MKHPLVYKIVWTNHNMHNHKNYPVQNIKISRYYDCEYV